MHPLWTVLDCPLGRYLLANQLTNGNFNGEAKEQGGIPECRVLLLLIWRSVVFCQMVHHIGRMNVNSQTRPFLPVVGVIKIVASEVKCKTTMAGPSFIFRSCWDAV